MKARRARLDAGRMAAFGLIALGFALLAWPSAWRATVTASALDWVSGAADALGPARALPVPIVIVEIDSATLAALSAASAEPGWRRTHMANLLARLAAARPAVVALDFLYDAADPRSPAALLGELARRTGRADLEALAATEPDGDRQLAEAIALAPTVLGFTLDPERPGRLAGAPFLAGEGTLPPRHWQGAGVGPVFPAFQRAAAGIGMLALPGDPDGVVRHVPLMVSAGGEFYPGLAAEALRVEQGASAFLLAGVPAHLQIGAHGRRLPDGAMIRLVPGASITRAIRTISALDILEARGEALPPGAIVFVGSAAPELGGLRAGSGDALVPSVRFHARAAAQWLVGQLPREPEEAGLATLLLLGAGMALGTWLGFRATPLAGAAIVALLLAALPGGAIALAAGSGLLVEPFLPALGVLGAFALASGAVFVETRRREAQIRDRFAQRLAPQVVAMIVAEPGRLKLSGERRQVTALFTDIEGFTALTEQLPPEAMVSLLDRYFEGVAGLVVAHGGMIDKFVGDAVHALFNAPFDQPGHERQAVACALAIRAWTEEFAASGPGAGLGLGRTRIGVETGEAVVGDVGVGAKLDYTAYGSVMNAAARLESANKRLGSAICLGPALATALDPAEIRLLGQVELAGFAHPVRVYAPVEPPARG